MHGINIGGIMDVVIIVVIVLGRNLITMIINVAY